MINYIRIWLASKIKWLRPYLLTKREQEKVAIVQLRSLLHMMGCNTVGWSDKEMVDRVTYAGKVLSKVGVSINEEE